MKKIIFLITIVFSFSSTALDREEERVSMPSLQICQEENCADHLDLDLSYDYGLVSNSMTSSQNTDQGSDDCIDCKNTLEGFEPFHDFNLARELGEIAQVGLLAEVVAGGYDADDKKKHVRAGAYIGYVSKKACQYGPELLKIDYEIGLGRSISLCHCRGNSRGCFKRGLRCH